MNLGKAMAIKAGGTSVADLRWLAEKAQGCTNILELGSHHGRSTRAMLDNSTARLWCVDSWSGIDENGIQGRVTITERDYQIFLENIADAQGRVTVMPMFTREAFNVLPAGIFDLIFIDADHEYEAVKFDIENSLPLLSPSGLLCGHDYNERWPGVGRAVGDCFGDEFGIGGHQIWYYIPGIWDKTRDIESPERL